MCLQPERAKHTAQVGKSVCCSRVGKGTSFGPSRWQQNSIPGDRMTAFLNVRSLWDECTKGNVAKIRTIIRQGTAVATVAVTNGADLVRTRNRCPRARGDHLFRALY